MPELTNRIRNVRPGFFRHQILQELEVKYPELHPMLVFAGLWSVCDKNGNFYWDVYQIKLLILPSIHFEMSQTLAVLMAAGFITEYWDEDGNHYGSCPNFTKYQRISGHECARNTSIPLPPNGVARPYQPRSKFDPMVYMSPPGDIGKQVGSESEASTASVVLPGELQGSEKNANTQLNNKSTTYSPGSNGEATAKQQGSYAPPRLGTLDSGLRTRDSAPLSPPVSPVEGCGNSKPTSTVRNRFPQLNATYNRQELALHILQSLELQALPVMLVAVTEAIRNTAKTKNISDMAAHDEIATAAYTANQLEKPGDWLAWFAKWGHQQPGQTPEGWMKAKALP